MKRKLILMGIISFIVAFSVYAQSSSTNAGRLVGTWIASNSGTWIFNANGTYHGTYFDNDNGKYGATETMLAIIDDDGDVVLAFTYSISADGKTLILLAQGLDICLTKKT
jgi:hypothetical protein